MGQEGECLGCGGPAGERPAWYQPTRADTKGQKASRDARKLGPWCAACWEAVQPRYDSQGRHTHNFRGYAVATKTVSVEQIKRERARRGSPAVEPEEPRGPRRGL